MTTYYGPTWLNNTSDYLLGLADVGEDPDELKEDIKESTPFIFAPVIYPLLKLGDYKYNYGERDPPSEEVV